MVTTSETTITLSDGLKVYTKTFQPVIPPSAKALFLHGFSDHTNAYTVFPYQLAKRGVLLTSFDQRGFGQTSPDRPQWGSSGPTSKILSDIDEVLSQTILSPSFDSSLPLYIIGHSMGGGIALTYALKGTHKEKLTGVVVWSPFLELAPESRPSRIVATAGKVAAKLLPGRKMVNTLDPRFMCRDERVCKAFVEDPLCHDTGTLEGLSAMLERGKWLAGGKGWSWRESCRLYVTHGTGDKVTDWRTSKRFLEMAGAEDKEWKEYDGWFHKLHEEPGEDKIRFANDVARWILKPTMNSPSPKL